MGDTRHYLKSSSGKLSRKLWSYVSLFCKFFVDVFIAYTTPSWLLKAQMHAFHFKIHKFDRNNLSCRINQISLLEVAHFFIWTWGRTESILTARISNGMREGNVLTGVCQGGFPPPRRVPPSPAKVGTPRRWVPPAKVRRYLPPAKISRYPLAKVGTPQPMWVPPGGQDRYAAPQGLATWRTVCLLRSRRRTFLLTIIFVNL